MIKKRMLNHFGEASCGETNNQQMKMSQSLWWFEEECPRQVQRFECLVFREQHNLKRFKRCGFVGGIALGIQSPCQAQGFHFGQQFKMYLSVTSSAPFMVPDVEVPARSTAVWKMNHKRQEWIPIKYDCATSDLVILGCSKHLESDTEFNFYICNTLKIWKKKIMTTITKSLWQN